jgi:hypothetical protein
VLLERQIPYDQVTTLKQLVQIVCSFDLLVAIIKPDVTYIRCVAATSDRLSLNTVSFSIARKLWVLEQQGGWAFIDFPCLSSTLEQHVLMLEAEHHRRILDNPSRV